MKDDKQDDTEKMRRVNGFFLQKKSLLFYGRMILSFISCEDIFLDVKMAKNVAFLES